MIARGRLMLCLVLFGRLLLLPGLIDPQDIANAALYLASRLSRELTGRALPVDTGWSMSCSTH